MSVLGINEFCVDDYHRLAEEQGYPGSYSSVKRYVRELLELELREREVNWINRMVKTAGFQVIKTLENFVWNQNIELPAGRTRE